MNKVSKSILLRHDKAGDAIKTLPALRALRSALPNEEIHIVCTPHNASLLEVEPGVKLHCLTETVTPAFIETINQCGPFDRLINLLSDPFESSDQLLTRIQAVRRFSRSLEQPELARRFNIISVASGSPQNQNEILNIAQIIEASFGIGLDIDLSANHAPTLTAGDKTEAMIQMGTKASERWLGICPFAGLQNRSHPIERWNKLFLKIVQKGGYDKYFLLGTVGNLELMNSWKQQSNAPEKVYVCTPSTFRSLGAFLERLDGVVAVDSGPLHFAYALGIRALGILSGGDVERWFPTISQRDSLLRRGLIDRFPFPWEMLRAYKRWESAEETPSI